MSHDRNLRDAVRLLSSDLRLLVELLDEETRKDLVMHLLTSEMLMEIIPHLPWSRDQLMAISQHLSTALYNGILDPIAGHWRALHNIDDPRMAELIRRVNLHQVIPAKDRVHQAYHRTLRAEWQRRQRRNDAQAP